MRKCLEKNKIYFETVTAVLLSLMAIFVSCAQFNISRTQLILSENPRIIIEPSDVVKGSTGEFELSIRNLSLAELYNIRIYEDYFVTETRQDGSIGLVSVGPFITAPKSIISKLKPNTKENITINFKDIINNMKEYYREHESYQMRFVRLKVKYCRKLDGKEFVQTKAYIIAFGDTILIDHDERGIRSLCTPSYDIIKNILGVDN